MEKKVENIFECNKLIAEFMGFEGQHEDWCGNNVEVPDEFSETGKTMVEYNVNENWGWLMPVVEKISSHVYEVEKADEYSGVKEIKHRAFLRTFGPGEGEWMVRFNRFPLHCAPTLIEAAYAACVQFIEWHKQQTLK